MKNKKSTALLLAILMMASVFLNATSVFAEGKQETPRMNQLVKKTEVKEELNKIDGLEINKEEVPDAVGEPTAEKNFTVTKDSGGTTTTVGGYDKFYDAVGAMDVNDAESEYTIYLNKDTTVSKEERGGYYNSKNKFRLTSGKGGPYTLKREGEWGILGIGDVSELTVDNITLDGNKTCQCFFISDNGKVTLGNGATIQNFVDSQNEDGPAIYVTGGTLNIEDGAVIQNNESKTTGGVILAYNGSSININGGTFKNNKAEKDGGAIAAYGVLNITGGTFENNTSAKGGGVVRIGNNSVAKISNALFKNNEARTGGAISVGNNLSIKDSTFENNKAIWGGAVFSSKKLTVENSKFTNNSVTSAGGALYLQGGAEIKDSTFTGNSAASDGGAVYSVNADVDIGGCTFEKNDSKARGGALFLSGQKNYIIKNSTIKNNKAKEIGGGITSLLGNLTVEDSIIDSNNSSSLGGGIVSVAGKTTNLNKCVIKNNTANGAGGVFVGTGGTQIKGTVNIKGTEFNGNDTGESGDQTKLLGGGLYIDADIPAKISESSKFINNKSGMGGAIFDASLDYKNPADVTKYQNLTIDKTTLFEGNVARAGLFAPPTNYDKFTNLAFSDTSDTPYNKYMSKSLLNNYDINYKGKILIVYDANGGKFADGKEIITELHEENEVIKLKEAPTREGYKFLYWSEEEYKPRADYKVTGNQNFVAQWEKVGPKKPDDPKKPDNHPKGGTFLSKPADTPLLNRKDHAQYMIGYPDQNFKPDNKMSRQEVTVMFSRLLNERPQKGMIYSRDYKDIPDNLWSATAISYMSKLGMVKGYPDGNFMPRADITRAEFAAMATRFADISAGSKTFTDVAKDHWAYDVIQKAAGAGWISGYPDGSFKPDQPITRAEVVAITNRMLNRFADEAYVDTHQDKILQFKDMKKEMWSYYPVVEATNGHGYERKANGKDEIWFEVKAASFVYDK